MQPIPKNAALILIDIQKGFDDPKYWGPRNAPEYGCEKSGLSSVSGACVRKLTEQQVTRAVNLTLRDLARYGELGDGLFKAGVTDLGAVEVDRSDRRALEQKAWALAMADAHTKAAGLAESAGVTLGAVYSISE